MIVNKWVFITTSWKQFKFIQRFVVFFFNWYFFYRVDDSKSEDNSEIYASFKPNIEELEMLLEAYFAQIDGILQKLSDVCIFNIINGCQYLWVFWILYC